MKHDKYSTQPSDDTRIALLELSINHINETLKELKDELKDMRAEFKDMRAETRSEFNGTSLRFSSNVIISDNILSPQAPSLRATSEATQAFVDLTVSIFLSNPQKPGLLRWSLAMTEPRVMAA